MSSSGRCPAPTILSIYWQMGGTQLDFRLFGFIWCSVYPSEKQDIDKICTQVALCTEAWIIFHVIIFLLMEFSRQEYWSGLSFPFPGDLPDPGIEPGSPALQTDALLSEPSWKPLIIFLEYHSFGYNIICFIYIKYISISVYHKIDLHQKLQCFSLLPSCGPISLISHPPAGALWHPWLCSGNVCLFASHLLS